MWDAAIISSITTLLSVGVVAVLAALGRTLWIRHRAGMEVNQAEYNEERTAVKEYQDIVRELNRRIKRFEDKSDEQRRAMDALARDHLHCRVVNEGLYQELVSLHHITCMLRDEIVNLGGQPIDIPSIRTKSSFPSEGEFLHRQVQQSERLIREVEGTSPVDDETKQ